MDIATIQQAVESIKTLNLNLNASTTDKLADIILPLYRLSILKDVIRIGSIIMVFCVIAVIVYFIGKKISN